MDGDDALEPEWAGGLNITYRIFSKTPRYWFYIKSCFK